MTRARRTGRLAVVLIATAPLLAAWGVERVSHGQFADVAVYRPAGDAAQFVLFLSGDDGWNAAMDALARVLVRRGAMVAGVDVRTFVAARSGDCGAAVGELENLSHFLQGYARLATYHVPLLLGEESGATLARATATDAPAGMFIGPLLLERGSRRGDGPCDDVRAAPGSMLTLPDRATPEAVPSTNALLASAYERLAASAPATVLPPGSLRGLPIVEVPAKITGDSFAVLLSGDGGWAGLDKALATALAARGVPVAGVDSLRYFWQARTPALLAADLDRVLRYYAARWARTSARLIGYSQGADVMPFAVNRLPPASRALVTQVVLLGPAAHATFEFHLSNWFGIDHDGPLVLPEISRLDVPDTLCVYGLDDDATLCPDVTSGHVRALALPGGHHFDGAYRRLAQLILARPAAP